MRWKGLTTRSGCCVNGVDARFLSKHCVGSNRPEDFFFKMGSSILRSQHDEQKENVCAVVVHVAHALIACPSQCPHTFVFTVYPAMHRLPPCLTPWLVVSQCMAAVFGRHACPFRCQCDCQCGYPTRNFRMAAEECGHLSAFRPARPATTSNHPIRLVAKHSPQ